MKNYKAYGIALPANLKESIDQYVEQGVPTGDFLRACINNNLCDAVGRADERSMKAIPVIVSYLYNECPGNCWGSAGAWEGWIEEKRKQRAAVSV